MRADDPPSVSVIVPVYDDPSGLRETLDSLVAQTYPASAHEVVVVDNGSTDETLAVARAAAAAHPVVRVERETDRQGSYAARNAGIRATDGEILAFVDADVTVPGDWIEAGVAAMDARDAAYLGCRVDVGAAKRTLAGLYDAYTGFPVERYVAAYGFAPTCALFVARAVVREVGAFDADLVSGGDVEFGHRVAAAGYDLHYADEVRVEHPARTSLRSLLGKHVRVGRGISQRRRTYPDRYDPGPVYHPIGFLPPHPLRFPGAFGDDWRRLSAGERAGLYAVGYLKRLSRTAGRIADRLDAVAHRLAYRFA